MDYWYTGTCTCVSDDQLDYKFSIFLSWTKEVVFTKLWWSVGGEVQQKLWICWRSLSGESATVLHRNSKADVSIISTLSQELKLEKSPLEFLAWPIYPIKSVDKSKCLHFPHFSMQPIEYPNILTAAIKLANFGWLLQMLTPVKIKLGNRFSY